MARRRPPRVRNADVTEALEEAETIEVLAGYRLSATDPEFADGRRLSAEKVREFAEQHPDHPAVVALKGNLDAAAEIRREALATT